MRVAFSIVGGAEWTGGINYLRNLLSALAELPPGSISPLLFCAPDADTATVESLRPYLNEPPITVDGWQSGGGKVIGRTIGRLVLQRDKISEMAFSKAGVDVVFQHATWYGLRFGLPTVAWIPDFQHKHLPYMFSRFGRLKREVGYRALCRSATTVMVSSQDAANDCRQFYAASLGRIEVLPFCVSVARDDLREASERVRQRYALPERFFYLPNQLWRHKNHLLVLEALKILKDQGEEIVVVASGNPVDTRNPSHPDQVLQAARTLGVVSKFLYLGMIPYQDIAPLMVASHAVVNPSLFEGWSTTVEESKALGVRLILSDLSVHREQANGRAVFFDPRSPQSLADAFRRVWKFAEPERDAGSLAATAYQRSRMEFAHRFFEIVQSAKSTSRRGGSRYGGNCGAKR